ncbi:MAG: hypothetical protein ACRDEA_22015 [Microcystaceae cyanobacterium]
MKLKPLGKFRVAGMSGIDIAVAVGSGLTDTRIEASIGDRRISAVGDVRVAPA